MSPVVSLRLLTEPAYVLLGGLLPDTGSGEARVLVSPVSVVAYPAPARPLLEYLAVLRSRPDAVAEIARWDGEADDLDRLSSEGLLVRFPPADEEAVRDLLSRLTVRVTAEPALAADGRSVLLRLPGDRAVDIDLLTAAVLDGPVTRSLGGSVAAVAAAAGLEEDSVWRAVVHDLTGILTAGAGHLARMGDRA